ncbi:MAG: HlyD family efflux transporter periplasmic adaptor subunit [Pseudomonadota bacterium]
MDGALKADAKEAVPLPILRDDLEIVPAAAQTNGAPAWVIYDPVASRYFEIGREILDMLLLWRVGTVDVLIRKLRSEFGKVVSEEEVSDTMHFLISNALVRDIPGNDFRTMAQKEAEKKKSWLSTAMHSYLFFRIPLFRPDRFLRATWPVVWPLFTRAAVWIYVLMGVVGLYLVSRQWDQFTGTFQFMMSWHGAALYFASLVFVKSIHELGHAYMAVRYGLRVPTIGIAFMVLMPVLYTDTSGAWRLPSRRKRLMIDGAGIFTELTMASIATLVWVFLPDGGLRLCVFAIATTSWVTSLVVNLNPLMRFDGYYILSDTLGFGNLQNRSFEMARWRMRELLFGLGEAPPEQLSTRLRRMVIVHAWATWIYRFFLFLGIALLVYTFFIKIVGILLFVVEILWFILMPLGREMAHWWSIREQIMAAKRILVTGFVLAGLVVLSIIPWSTHITVPSLMTAQQEQRLFAPFPAQVVTMNFSEGAQVRAGDVLVELASPKLERDHALALERQALLESRIDRTSADAEDRASLIVLENELKEVREELDGLKRVRAKMVLRAPFDGTLSDLDPELHVGLWINPKTPLGMVRTAGASRIRGYVSEREVFRFKEGAKATFIPDNPELPPIKARVSSVAEASAEKLREPYLAMTYGGSIAVEQGPGSGGDSKALRPMEAEYPVALAPFSEAAMPAMAVRGVTRITGKPRSFYSRAKQQVLKVLVREMGV